MIKTRTMAVPKGITPHSSYSVRIHSRNAFILCVISSCLTVYASVFLAIAGTASDTFGAYFFLVSGWGNPLLIALPFTIGEEASSALSNLQPIFDVLRGSQFHER